MLPPGWTPGLEVGVGNPSRSAQVDSNGSTWCPCLVFVGPTSDCFVDVAARSPGAGRPLPVEIDEVGTVVVPRAKTDDCRGCHGQVT
jgi:hypothetical protein